MGKAEDKLFNAATVESPRRVLVGPVPVMGTEVEWRTEKGFSIASVPEPLLSQLAAAIRAQGLAVVDAVLVRHRARDSGLPDFGRDGEAGFVLDLTDARRTIDGGLLLFVDQRGGVTGWRAETGALTIWSGQDPLLTELAPGAPERIVLFGRARRL